MEARTRNASGKAKVLAAGVVAVLLALMFAIALIPGQASAAPENGNIPVEEDINATPDELMALAEGDLGDIETITSEQGMALKLGRDYVWAGETQSISGTTIDNDLLLAGNMMSVEGVKVGGSIRAAGDSITIANAAVTENITIAGNMLSLAGGKANDVCMAGNSVTYTGTSSALHIYGNKVLIDGTVNGDVRAGGNIVEIGPNAKITGTLYVTAPSSPNIPDSAKIGDILYTQGSAGNLGVLANIDFDDIGNIMNGIAKALTILFIFISIVGTLLISIFSELFFRRQTAGAARMFATRTGKTIATGVIGAIAAPIALVILCVLVVTLPIAGALGLGLLAIALVCEGFMAASIFKLAFKNMGRFKVAIIGGLIVGILSAIPFVRIIVAIVAFVYMLGYVFQRIYLSMREPEGEHVVIEDLPAA